MNRLNRVAVLALLLCATPALFAQTDAHPQPGHSIGQPAGRSIQSSTEWDQLRPEQQRMVNRLLQNRSGGRLTEQQARQQWQSMAEARQRSVLRGIERWNSLSGEQRKRVNQRMERWRSLPDAERNKIRERFHHYQRLPDSDRAKIRERMREFQRMPPQRQQELRQRWRQLSPEQKRRLQGQVRRLPGAGSGIRPGKPNRHSQNRGHSERQR